MFREKQPALSELSFEDFETMAGGGEKTQKQVQFLPKNEPLVCG